jgi:hypothetical protein
MSIRTKHLTVRQRQALACEKLCIRQKKFAEAHWMRAAPYFAKMLNEQLYAELDFGNFSAWCDSIGISGSHGYLLAQIYNLPQPIQDSLQRKNVGLGKANLIMHRLNTAVEVGNMEAAEGIVEKAATMRYHDIRQDMMGDDPIFKPVPINCPHCGYILELSRAASIEKWYKGGSKA